MKRSVRSIVLTGASGGLGRALAEEYASPGVTILLLGRNETRLSATAVAVRALGGAAQTASTDVRDAHAMALRILRFDADHPVDLVIANAGASGGRSPLSDRAASEPPEPMGAVAELVAVNLIGAAATVEPLLAPMARRRRGRVALIGSLAGICPLPDLPAYSASKAGLIAWGDAIRGAMAPHGVGVTIANLGFVDTPMCMRHNGFRPQLLTAKSAAARVRRAIDRGHNRLTIPRLLGFLAWLATCIPSSLTHWSLYLFRASITLENIYSKSDHEKSE